MDWYDVNSLVFICFFTGKALPNLRTSAGDILAAKEDIFQELRLKVILLSHNVESLRTTNLLHFAYYQMFLLLLSVLFLATLL